MKNALRLTVLAAALSGAFPALAQSNAEVLNELKALRDRVDQITKDLDAAKKLVSETEADYEAAKAGLAARKVGLAGNRAAPNPAATAAQEARIPQAWIDRR